MEDDNPKVAGKGIEHLKRNGVNVHMFDRDLQKLIHEQNNDFFEWARSQPEPSGDEGIKLSKYEDPVELSGVEDLSDEALEMFRVKANGGENIDSHEFRRLLTRLGCLEKKDGGLLPTGFGFLLFGKRPRDVMPQAGLLAKAEFQDGKLNRQEFNEALVLIPEAVERWLAVVLPSSLDRSRMQRNEKVDLPFEMIREAVINALVHRNYDIEGANTQLVVNSEIIEVTSPGGPIDPITLDQLRSFKPPIKSRNPVLHYVFARMGMAEEQGFGLTSLRRRATELGLPLPYYQMKGDALSLTIYRTKEAAVTGLPVEIQNNLSKSEVDGWQWVSGQQVFTSSDYQAAMQVPTRTALNHLKHFAELGLIQKTGAGPATKYQARRR